MRAHGCGHSGYRAFAASQFEQQTKTACVPAAMLNLVRDFWFRGLPAWAPGAAAGPIISKLERGIGKSGDHLWTS